MMSKLKSRCTSSDAYKTTSWNYNAVIENETIDYNRNLQGWNTLSVSNVTVLSSVVSEFKAREEIHISGDFYAETGSDVHIYTTETFPECTDFSSYLRIANPNANGANKDETNGIIEISFMNANSDFDFFLIPNPTEGHFILEMKGLSRAINSQLIIYSPLGEIIFSDDLKSIKTDLNLAIWARGIYSIQIINESFSINKKLILQ